MKWIFVIVCFIGLLNGSRKINTVTADDKPGKITFTVQKRIPAQVKDSFTVVREKQQWDASKTAIIICDMWNQHWCKGATARVGEMAPYMNEVLAAARKQGIFIVHAPSECMDHYKDHPARKAAEKYAAFGSAADDGTVILTSEKGAAWPIDQSNEGCNDTPRCELGNPWTKQIDLLKIEEGDVISDSGKEISGLFREKGIDHVILMGVHTNMCVVNRSFGMRNMSRFGMKVSLMRDLTDAMYDSRQAPYVDHFQGLGLMIGYIEKYIGSTVLSTDITGKAPFKFNGDTRLN